MGGTAHRGGGRGRPHLLVWLHFPADHPEGFGCGIVIDLDSAEGLGACASRQPPLVAVIVKHHSGPAGADNCLAARKETEREGSWLAQGSTAPSFQGLVTFSVWMPLEDSGTMSEEERDTQS